MATAVLVLASLAMRGGPLAARPRVGAAAAPLLCRPVSHARAALGAGAASAGGSSSNLYRMFGISEDAAYDEIMAAYERLCTKFADDKKQLIKLEVSKDRILEDRLRRRMSGTLQSKVVESEWDRAQRTRKKKPLNEYLPAWMQQFIEIPDEEFAGSMATIFGLLTAMPLLVPTMASTVRLRPSLLQNACVLSVSATHRTHPHARARARAHACPQAMVVGYLVSNGVLYNRGIPKRTEDDGRPAKLKPLLITLAITSVLGGIGFSIGVTIASNFFAMSQRVRAPRAQREQQPGEARAREGVRPSRWPHARRPTLAPRPAARRRRRAA